MTTAGVLYMHKLYYLANEFEINTIIIHMHWFIYIMLTSAYVWVGVSNALTESGKSWVGGSHVE